MLLSKLSDDEGEEEDDEEEEEDEDEEEEEEDQQQLKEREQGEEESLTPKKIIDSQVSLVSGAFLFPQLEESEGGNEIWSESELGALSGVHIPGWAGSVVTLRDKTCRKQGKLMTWKQVLLQCACEHMHGGIG